MDDGFIGSAYHDEDCRCGYCRWKRINIAVYDILRVAYIRIQRKNPNAATILAEAFASRRIYPW